jgi:glycosyltransferase involved in cell wall biosynthesis
MRIAWYTPLSVNSAIGRFSRLVVHALRGMGVEVQMVRSEAKPSAVRGNASSRANENYVWAADLQRNIAQHLRAYDLVVYNVGDHYDFHAYCFQHQPLVPGLTILHDYCLHHALHHYCVHSPGLMGPYRDRLAGECGDDAAAVFDQLQKSGHASAWWQQEIARYPVYRWAIADTLGVITHANFYRQSVATSVGCPVVTIPLAYDTPSGVAPAPDPKEQLTIITVGAVNANKRHEAVIRALAESPMLGRRCCYRIVGAASAAQQQAIASAVASYSQAPQVTLVGQVTREVLREELAAANIISCLRYPALEGASASVVEGLLSGRPVVACDTGCYQEIPDDLFFKVAPDDEHAQLTQALETIADDYPAALGRARAAKEWAARRHAPSAYAKQLLTFADRVLYNRPVLQLTDRIASRLRSWNTQPHPVLLQQVDQAMYDLFGRPGHQQGAA